MKLTFSPASPFARKLRIIAIELKLIDRIELVPTSMMPGKFNPDYSTSVNPLRKLPALLLDDGRAIVDSFVIAEYLNELGGGALIPPSGEALWQARSEHSILQGMLEAMLLCRYERMVRPENLRWQTWYDDQWDRAWQGFSLFESRPETLSRPFDLVQIALVCALGYADFRFADCGWRQAFPKLHAFNELMIQRASVQESMPPPA